MATAICGVCGKQSALPKPEKGQPATAPRGWNVVQYAQQNETTGVAFAARICLCSPLCLAAHRNGELGEVALRAKAEIDRLVGRLN